MKTFHFKDKHMIEKQTNLYYQDYKSDKVYYLLLSREGSKYRVTAQFGPRGGTVTQVDKTRGLVSWIKANEVFDKTEREKRAKGYEDIETPRQTLIKRLKLEIPISWLSDSTWNKIADFIEGYVEEQA